MENSTNLLLIPIAVILLAFICRWYTKFVDAQIAIASDRYLLEIKAACEQKQIMDDKYNE